MPIIERHGDLLVAPMDVLAHGCNCFCVMGAGIAGAIRAKYPCVYEADCTTEHGDRSKLGSFTNASTDDGKTIFNLYTQFHFGTGLQLDYAALLEALFALKDWLDAEDPEHNLKVGLPRIGCGLAGGDWKQVESIIQTVFQYRTVYVYST